VAVLGLTGALALQQGQQGRLPACPPAAAGFHHSGLHNRRH
jgi:hypothetical protein